MRDIDRPPRWPPCWPACLLACGPGASWVPSWPLPFRAALLAVSVITSPFRDPCGSLPGPALALLLLPLMLLLLWPRLRRRFSVPALMAPLAQRGDLILEVGKRLKAPVNRGESQVGNLVKLAERAQNGQAHLVRGDFGQAAGPDRLLHLLGQDGELVLVHRPALAGALHAVDDLVPGEGLGDAAALGHHQDHRLLSGEPAPAFRTGPPAPDRGTVFGRPAVDDPAVGIPAERAVHAITS